MTDVPDILAAMKDRCDAATEGPCHVDEVLGEDGEVIYRSILSEHGGLDKGKEYALFDEGNAILMASAFTDIPRLVEAVEYATNVMRIAGMDSEVEAVHTILQPESEADVPNS